MASLTVVLCRGLLIGVPNRCDLQGPVDQRSHVLLYHSSLRVPFALSPRVERRCSLRPRGVFCVARWCLASGLALCYRLAIIMHVYYRSLRQSRFLGLKGQLADFGWGRGCIFFYLFYFPLPLSPSVFFVLTAAVSLSQRERIILIGIYNLQLSLP